MINNLEAEQHIIGAILLEPDCLLQVLDIVQPQDFYKESHKEILNACLDLYQDGNSIDLVGLTERLSNKGVLDNVGGASYLSAILNIVPTSANVKYHARIVKDKALLRNINLFSQKLQRDTKEGCSDVKQLLSEIEGKVISLSENVTDKKNPNIGDIIFDVKKQWQEISEGKQVYIPADFMFADVLPQYMPGDIIMVGGYTSVGKSTLLAQMIIDACDEKAKCLIFSTEDSREDKVIKIISNLADIPQKYLMVGDLLDSQDKVNEAIEKLKTYNLKIYDDIDTIDEMRLKIKKHKMQDGVNIVAIDYIQNISGPGEQYHILLDASKKLQKIAKELQITFLVLSQVSNESMKGGSQVIGLKGAGELASVADIVFELYMVKGVGKEHYLDCHTKKNRPFGTTAIVRLQFSDKWTKIEKRWIN